MGPIFKADLVVVQGKSKNEKEKLYCSKTN